MKLMCLVARIADETVAWAHSAGDRSAAVRVPGRFWSWAVRRLRFGEERSPHGRHQRRARARRQTNACDRATPFAVRSRSVLLHQQCRLILWEMTLFRALNRTHL